MILMRRLTDTVAWKTTQSSFLYLWGIGKSARRGSDGGNTVWFKKEEVIEFLGAQKERPHSGQHEEHPGGSSSTKQNTEHLLQNMFRNLVESEKEYFENYDDVLSHPKIKKILADQNFQFSRQSHKIFAASGARNPSSFMQRRAAQKALKKLKKLGPKHKTWTKSQSRFFYFPPA